MKQISVMLKPASGLCNMRCAYCFYADLSERREIPNYGKMSAETAHKIIDNVFADLSAGDRALFAFQGGEPTMAGIPFFADFFSYAAENCGDIHLDFALQTNGYCIDEEWCRLLQKYPVLVGLSLDGYKQLHDSYRRDAADKDTFRRVMEAKRLLETHRIPYNVLTVLTGQSARHPQKLWSFFVKEHIDFVQIIPCLDGLDTEDSSPFALHPERFYRFYAALFPLWIQQLQQGRYISIKLFDDLANYYLRGQPTACGMDGRCNVQFVCESDGSVFPCDFYMLDAYRMGSLAEKTPAALYEKGLPFLEDSRAYAKASPCLQCRYQQSCHGGCKRMKDSMYIDGDFCWYAKLLDEILEPLLHAARQLMRS